MKVLVTGAKGQLGSDVVSELKKRGHETIGVDVEEMDITDPEEVTRVMSQTKPETVIHCAAYTAVDRAEDEKELCRKINSEGTKNIAKQCGKQQCKLIYISTDYVFDGTGERSWMPNDNRSPINFYGQTKYEGEKHVQALTEKHFIVRISWVFGKNGANFVNTMLRLAEKQGEINVVADQIGSPTYTADLKTLLSEMAESDRYGIYHATNAGYCSWYDFAKEIFRLKGLDIKVNPVTSKEFPSKAKRPKNSRMNLDALRENGFTPLPSWEDAVRRYLE